ncbi:MAG: WYL domain-containing protein [Anaerolineae bacterium]|nr:WYL domain-containing protein [Anaerolineae bacterium]
MSQRQQLERILEIDRQVRAGLFPNADRLAQSLGVGKRVIYNDRTFMLDRLKAPLVTDRVRGGWYYTDAAYTLPNIMATQGELFAFFLSVEVAQRYMGTAFQEPLLSVLDKLAQTMTGDISVDLETLRQHYSFVPPPLLETNPQHLMTLHQAIQARKLIDLGYHANTTNEFSERIVEPYHLHNLKGDWYVLTYDPAKDDKRTFHVGRIQSCRLLPDTFVRRESLSIPTWLKEAFGAEGGGTPVEVVIRFSEFQSRWIRERKWHNTAKIEPQADGGVVLRLWTSGLGEVRRWVMQFGGQAEVEQPESLRQQIADDVQKMAAAYA